MVLWMSRANERARRSPVMEDDCWGRTIRDGLVLLAFPTVGNASILAVSSSI